MPKFYVNNSTKEAALRGVLAVFGVKSVAGKDQFGPFYDVEIPIEWEGRRRSRFEIALEGLVRRK